MNQTDPTTAVEVLARLLCAADVHVHDGDHPTWQQLSVAQHGRGQDDYRRAARWLLPRMTVATKPAAVSAVVSPPTDRDAAPTDEDILVSVEEALERVLLPYDGAAAVEAARDAVLGALRPLVDQLRQTTAGAQQQPDTEARPARGDAAEAWLKAQRDAAADYPEAYNSADGLLDLYRLHADTGTPLGEHVCEARVVGQCECLEAAPVAQQPAAAETDEERADREATERDHARGDHTHCGITCEIEMPTEHLRNFVIAKGYPGTRGALDELLRRARAEVAEQQPAAADDEDPVSRAHVVAYDEQGAPKCVDDCPGCDPQTEAAP